MLIDTSNLCGTAEAATVLGVLKQRIHTLRKRSDFPQPIVVLAATPLWDKDAPVSYTHLLKVRLQSNACRDCFGRPNTSVEIA